MPDRVIDVPAYRSQLSRSVRGAPRHQIGDRVEPARTDDLVLMRNPNHLHIFEDFVGGLGVPVAGTATEDQTPGGWRVIGDGLAETDSGLVIQGGVLNGVARLTTTDEADHVAALATHVCLQPDKNAPVTLEARIKNPALTSRTVFAGFVGAAVAAMPAPITAATTTTTLVQDDLALAFFSSGLTENDEWHFAHNKSDAAATQPAIETGAPAVTTGFQIVRLVLTPDGDVELVISDAAGELFRNTYQGVLDADEELAAVVGVAATTTTVATLDVDYAELTAYRDLSE